MRSKKRYEAAAIGNYRILLQAVLEARHCWFLGKVAVWVVPGRDAGIPLFVLTRRKRQVYFLQPEKRGRLELHFQTARELHDPTET